MGQRFLPGGPASSLNALSINDLLSIWRKFGVGDVEKTDTPPRKWRIEFETGDVMLTEDEVLADLHRERGRIVTEVASDPH